MKMIIGGEKVDSSDGKIIEVYNPATQEYIDSVPCATGEDVEKCLDFAQKGKKAWKSTPLHERSRILLKYADLLEKNIKELSELQCREMGKAINECEFEVSDAPRIVKSFVERAKHLYGETLPADSQPWTEKDIVFTRREPLGVVACIVPFNYPVGLFIYKIAPALIMGNAIIVKPPSDDPLTITRMVELMIESGVPGNVAQVITGKGSIVGNMLIPSKKIDAVSLTGSTEVGIEVFKASAQYLHRVLLELGGNDALIVFDDGDLDLAINETVFGRAQNSGQTCCACKRFIIQNSVKDEFVKRLVERLKKLVIGNPLDHATEMGCMINEKAALQIEKQVKLTIEQGAKCILGGKHYNKTFFQPTVLVDVTFDMDIAKDMEVFGPVFPVIGFDTEEEAIEIANNTRYGLCGGVISNDVNKAIKTASLMECGTAVVNGSGFYRLSDHAFGGFKMSGLGREGASVTLEEMSQIKTYALKGALK